MTYTYGYRVHKDITKAIKNGDLDSLMKEQGFEYKPKARRDLSPTQRANEIYNMMQIFNHYYKPAIKDPKIYFQYNEITGVSVRARQGILILDHEDGEKINTIKGYRSIQLSQVEGEADPSCIQVKTNEKTTSLYNNKRNNIQYYKLLGSLSFLNHACRDCVTCVPFDFDLYEGSEYRDLSLRIPIKKDEEITIQYVVTEKISEVPFPCIKCNHIKL